MLNSKAQLAQVLLDVALTRQVVLGIVDQKCLRRLHVVCTVAHGEQTRVATQNAHALALVKEHDQAQHLLQHGLVLRLAHFDRRIRHLAV